MRRTEGFVILVVLLQLCAVRPGETKTIVFNSYSSGPSVSATSGSGSTSNGTGSVAQERSSESAGRAFGSPSGPSAGGFPFSLPSSYLSKPVQVARPVDSGYKTPKYIVYPSYTANSVPNYGGPVAMDRFAPGEAYGGTLYKLKKQRQPGGGGGSFASIPAASFNSPVSVAAPGPVLRPAASDNAPVVISAPPPPQPPGPAAGPGPSDGPPSSPTSDGGPPGPPATFIPTPNPSSGEDESTSPPSAGPSGMAGQQDSSELILSPPNSHIGYLPPDDQVPKKPKQPNMQPDTKKNPSVEVDLQKFPPNSDQSYPVPMMVSPQNPVTSYQPPASGNTDSRANVQMQPSSYKATPELFKFPPNVNSQYLPPTGSTNESKQPSVTSYLPPPSGDPQSPDNLKPMATNGASGAVAMQDLSKFPPNINVGYLPSKESAQSSVTSYLPPASGSPDAPANLVGAIATSSASDSTFKFPPNVNSNYLPPNVMTKPESHVTSYLPPASGSPDAPANLMAAISTSSTSDSTFKFPPNVNSNYLPPIAMAKPESHVTSYLPPASGDPNANYPHQSAPPSSSQPYQPPASLFQFPPNIHSPYLPPKNSPPRPNNAVTSYLPPASGIPGDGTIGTIPVGPGKPQYLPPYYDNRPPAPPASPPMNMPPMQMMQMMQMMKDTPMTGPPTGPSGMDAGHDHDHHHHDHHHDFPDFSAFDHDHYPDIIFDHDHDHYHHHHHDEPTTTPPPPPPPPPPPAPETPRLKNYSYYYLSRTLWYVPLYFTLYFTFYVAILIIRSIARHKVNLPNQWVGNGRSFGSIRDLSNAQTQQKASMMAAFTMKQIEDFREKYL
ncbi:hypothetical protein AND_002837 [Anopheles darlingi]|uniref:Uncharacterized protein n=1 Tax=Anopheles darlingi TaxID=43151 RepID=W5JM25_ANODA|nr:hypothetical protein AND_002837 [Anopheles darlingi]